MRYRLLETVRQYAQEKLGESGEADRCGPVIATTTPPRRLSWNRTAMRATMTLLVRGRETEIDNLRAAFTWSRENADLGPALQLVSSLRPFW